MLIEQTSKQEYRLHIMEVQEEASVKAAKKEEIFQTQLLAEQEAQVKYKQSLKELQEVCDRLERQRKKSETEKLKVEEQLASGKA